MPYLMSSVYSDIENVIDFNLDTKLADIFKKVWMEEYILTLTISTNNHTWLHQRIHMDENIFEQFENVNNLLWESKHSIVSSLWNMP